MVAMGEGRRPAAAVAVTSREVGAACGSQAALRAVFPVCFEGRDHSGFARFFQSQEHVLAPTFPCSFIFFFYLETSVNSVRF